MTTALRSISPLLLLTASACSNIGVGDSERNLCGYDLVFADEFDEMSIAPRILGNERWTAHTPWNGDFGDAIFSNPGGPHQPFRIRDGELRISASKDDKGQWRSGLIAAADASGKGAGVRYGYFETRIQFPAGPGTWPAFWLISLKPVADERPKIELDVVEYYGHRTDRYHVTGHVWYAKPDQDKTWRKGSIIPVESGSLVKDFHRYGALVEPETITYYFDRKPVWRQPTPPEHQTPLYPLVNLALGSGYSIENTPDPSIMKVDYVRVYRSSEGDARLGCVKL